MDSLAKLTSAVSTSGQWLQSIFTMNLKEKDGHQDLLNGNEEDNIFSEAILRQLCKTLRTIIPRNEVAIEEHTLM